MDRIAMIGYIRFSVSHFSWLGVILWASFPYSAQAPPSFSQRPTSALGYQLVFSDEFNTLDLGTEEDGSSKNSHTWYEDVWFSKQHSQRQHFSVENSSVSLIWKSGQSQPDSSISTFARNNPHYHAWRYGYFETRMKWRPEPGAWPAVWLIPVQAAQGGAPQESGEIDLFEGQGTEPLTLFGTIHRWKGSQRLETSSPHNQFRLPPHTNLSEFHTYGLLWVPGRVTWYFDGTPLHSESTYPVFDREDYFLVIGMQEGSDWKSGDLSGVSAQSLTLTVDWVRVWQLHSK
jgi:beta-glucanase (GH16 family)